MAEYIVTVEEDSKNFEEMFIGAIRSYPKLIRCKDCKYYTGKWCTKYSKKQFDINDICKDDDAFCSMAERKRQNDSDR